ncbi:MAG TPA: hypothetical protein VFA12_04730 [Stellaceae bacterium]|nr:hypothetical protein [Stellaceae bacterium]
MTRAVAFLALSLALCPSIAVASGTQQGKVVLQRWKNMDNCERQAQKAFPDFTAEANAKRDAAISACLSSGNLPPRQPVSPPVPK